ncbi:PEP/pyruvate-binding domain-containing protein [Mobilicoccus caccae]|uniref:Phosphoenolpyruvate synthase n=1 Tax=Mobilicoccus caccae TaxID=1859295 RepID=A0ABQ6INV7_9MICO|nr:PEP/pyruvate-binding domain-containing protein [Mobilicoccus caccae]GMA39612.1 phosphoenolpyruvate synthase [Mobilicoccus caccae]
MTGSADVGGKGANLIRLRDAGVPVPPFVVVPVEEYHEFVRVHGLDAVITEALGAGGAAAASALIRQAFRRPMSGEQRARLTDVVGDLAAAPVAVRSSATAEDLPEASFAGQQDTFLEVAGIDQILEKVIECWSSLWTERAITYRARNDVPLEGLGLAVVIQEQVAAEASGVVFTADPLTGRRDRVVVDAVRGLGEALVSGQVTPDHYEVEGPVVVERAVQGEAPVLSEAQLLALVRLCRRVATDFGAPQDIEFTCVGDELQIVQSRAITSLYPTPEGPREAVYISVGAIQGVLAPLTPLGREILTIFAAGAATVFGHTVDHRTNPFVQAAGERLWVRVDRLLTGPARRLVLRILPIGDPVAATIVRTLADEPAYAPRRERSSLVGVGRSAAGAVLPRLPRIGRNLRDPEAARARFLAVVEDYVAAVREDFAAAGAVSDPADRLRARLDVVEGRMSRALAVMFSEFLPVMGPSVLMLVRLRALAARTGLVDADALALTVLRSLPDNVTTEMDLALYAASRRIAGDPESVRAMTGEPGERAAAYRAGELPAVVTAVLGEFLDRYGMRGVAEIDVGAPRWREHPEQVVRTVQTYLGDVDHAASYEQGRRAAAEAIERLAAASSPVRAAQIRFLAGRLRGLFGLRETPKFTLVRTLGLVRTALAESGADLVAAGRLDAADDVFFLRVDELRTAFDVDHRGLVGERRAAREREGRRGQLPVVLLGDGRAFSSAPGSGDADLVGTGVSPGVVTAAVRVVDDPASAGLLPGEILVCRGTDPAWTPLFLTAGGLVTEVGGLMTHGSVVAREYGLPAVVGVGRATERLRTGEVITVHGSSGEIMRVE